MTNGILKSTTAMLLVVSMTVTPVASLAQEASTDTSAQTQEEIDAALLRLRLQAEADAEAKAQEETKTETGDVLNQAKESILGVTPDVEPAPEPTADAEAPAAEAPTAEAPVTEVPATEAPVAEAPVTETTAQDAPAPESAPAAEAAPEATPEPEATVDVAPEAPADAAPATDPVVAEQPTESSPEAAIERAEKVLRGETAEPAPETARTEDAPPMDSETQAEVQAEADAEASQSIAASGTGDGDAEVVEETVTEETARSSSEEFDTDLKGVLRVDQTAKEKKDDDKGLTTLEKAALLGLGAVAIGALLRKDESVAANTGDRIVVERDGQYRVIKNDDALLRQPGSDVTTYRYQDGSTRTVVIRADGTEVETVRAADGRVLRRTRTLEDGSTVVLFDDTRASRDVVINDLPQVDNRRSVSFGETQGDELAVALAAAQVAGIDRTFSLSQIRNIDAVRQLVPEINVDTINFETNSAVIRPDEAEELAALGNAMRRMIRENPAEVFLVEGHTDAVGAGSYNLALSDRRAESVALALTEYFDVPPENLVVQGYGESDLLVRTPDAERANRRAAVRRITPLLDGGV